MSRRSSRSAHSRSPLVVAATVLAVGLVVLAVTLVGLKQSQINEDKARFAESAPRTLPSPTPTKAPAPPKIRTTLAQAMSRLDDPTRPFRIAVLGDSTGVNAEIGWVELMLRWLADEYQRPLDTSWWSVTKKEHLTWTEAESRTNAPIITWNGSAGGKNFTYSKRMLDTLVPPSEQGKVDLLFINHGHNLAKPDDYHWIGKPFIEELLKEWPNAAIVLTAQNPERVETGKMTSLFTTVETVRDYAKFTGLPYVDVYEAFMATGDPDALIDDSYFHPTARGYRIWFREVVKVLEPAMRAEG